MQNSSLLQALNYTCLTCGFSYNANEMVSGILLAYAPFKTFILIEAIFDCSF